jgi:hypothetical protein
MPQRMTWPQILRTEKFKGFWVALDNCRYEPGTHKPVEGDVVDTDRELAALCGRMREMGRSACSVLFCDGDVFVERVAPSDGSKGPKSAPSLRSHH